MIIQNIKSAIADKTIGRKLLIWSAILNIITLSFDLFLSEVLSILNVDNDVFSPIFNFIGGLSMIGMVLGLLLWVGKYSNHCCNYHKPKTMSILDPRHPSGPNYWNRR